MARNRKFANAQQLSLPVPSGVVSGDPVLVGDALCGVALTDRGADVAGEAAVRTHGAFDLEVVAGAAMAVGDIVYIDAATLVLSDSAADVRFGYLLEPIAGASTVTVAVKVGF